MSELRDAIAIRIDPYDDIGPNSVLFRAADVLAMPEMQAVRDALYGLAEAQATETGYSITEVLTNAFGWPSFTALPPSVVAWVLEGEPPRSPMSNPIPVPVELLDDYTPIAAQVLRRVLEGGEQ